MARCLGARQDNCFANGRIQRYILGNVTSCKRVPPPPFFLWLFFNGSQVQKRVSSLLWGRGTIFKRYFSAFQWVRVRLRWKGANFVIYGLYGLTCCSPQSMQRLVIWWDYRKVPFLESEKVQKREMHIIRNRTPLSQTKTTIVFAILSQSCPTL